MEAPQKKVLVPIAYGSLEIDVVTIVDVFGLLGSVVTVASVEKDMQIECSSGVKLVADNFISDCESQIFDLVVLPGCMPGLERLRDCKVLRKITEAHAKEGRLYGALSEAPALVLETWGLLKGCQLSSAVAVDASIQVDGMVNTSQGPDLTVDFALSIAEQLFGKKLRNEELLKLMTPRGWNKLEIPKEEYNVDDWSMQNIPQVLVPIANRSDEMESVVVIDVLRRAKANVVLASVEDSLEIVAARGTKIVADRLLKDAILSNYDLIHLPGGWYGAQKLGSTELLVNLLREHAESNKVYGALCASAVMLDTKGLLKGKKATSHPHYSSKLSDQSSVNVRVVIDGKAITSFGPGTTMEYALSIVEKIFGMERAKEVAEAMAFSYP
jgi:4-methyl-5(b-hydroxyethyl)-thiazole monophosphate biosynthesis